MLAWQCQNIEESWQEVNHSKCCLNYNYGGKRNSGMNSIEGKNKLKKANAVTLATTQTLQKSKYNCLKFKSANFCITLSHTWTIV